MSTYEERLNAAGEICRLPGGYQVRTSERDEMIQVKGGTLKGWTRFTVQEAVKTFSLSGPPDDAILVFSPALGPGVFLQHPARPGRSHHYKYIEKKGK